MTLDKLINICTPDTKITVNGKPVYDYKSGNLPYVYLISDSYEGIEDENIDFSELVDFCNSLLQPHQTIEFADEFTNEPLKNFICQNGILNLTY